MNIHDLAEAFLKEGKITLDHGNHPMTFDLSNRHERLYAAKLLTDLPYPQTDIDTALINRLVRQGDHILDAGANIGFTALEFLQAGARHVTALEPIMSLYSRLDALRSDRLSPLPDALAASVGHAPMFVSEAHNQGSSLSETITGLFPSIFGATTEDVATTTIDALSQKGVICDIWKLDIEGAEVDALRGATNIFSENPPRVIIAELYEPFVADFLSALPDAFQFQRRAYLSETDYSLILQPIHVPIDVPVHHHSPMYVFAREDF